MYWFLKQLVLTCMLYITLLIGDGLEVMIYFLMHIKVEKK